jgi:hypothetical protein
MTISSTAVIRAGFTEIEPAAPPLPAEEGV